jgi:DNA invertase Pin-like site-specific DNA recombinase
LDGKKEEIKTLLALRVSKASIAKIMGVDRATLYHFMHSLPIGALQRQEGDRSSRRCRAALLYDARDVEHSQSTWQRCW